jgi:hypothetical protein
VVFGAIAMLEVVFPIGVKPKTISGFLKKQEIENERQKVVINQ